MKRLGTRQPLTERDFADLDKAARLLCSDIATVARERSVARERFYGLTPYRLDGIKRYSTKGERIKPFKGSANNAIRWGEAIVDGERAMVMEMLRRAERVVTAIGGGEMGERRAAALTRLLDWGINYMGDSWQRQLTLALNYALIDTPGVSMISVGWQKRTVMAPRRISKDDCVQLMLNVNPDLGSTATLDAINFNTYDVRHENAAMAALNLPRELACDVLDAFKDDDEVEVIAPVGMDEGPEIRAWQYGSDFVIPRKCSDLHTTSPWFRGEWVTEARLRELAAANDWSEEFVNAALDNKGKIVYDFDQTGETYTDRSEMIHLVWAYTIEATEGALTRWQTVLCAADHVTACGKELIRGNAGRFPVVLLAREHNSDSILDSRGIASIASPSLDLAKKLTDTGSNNAIIGGLPPVVKYGGEGKITLNPLSVISLRSSAEIKYLHPPAFPAQGNNEIERLHADLKDVFGLSTSNADPEVLAIRKRSRMAALLESMRTVMESVISVIQANASERLLLEVLGRDAADPQLRRDLSGNFQLALRVNIDDMTTKNVIEKVQALGQVIAPLDRNHQLDTAPILRCAVRNLFPNLGDEMIAGETEASGREIREEMDNFVKIKAGLRPQMNVDGGWNYEARLAFWQQQLQQNPSAIEEMSPEAQQFANEWMQALSQQVQQYGANAELGRTGSAEVMPE